MDIINLYTMSGCPRCKTLKSVCDKSKYIKSNDYKIVNIDPNDKKDTDFQMLMEHNIFDMPILLVNDNFYHFGEAMNYIRKKDTEFND